MKASYLLLSAVLVTAFTIPFRSAKTQAAGAGSSVTAKNVSVSALRTHYNKQGITVSWSTPSAADILDFILQRTYDNPTSSSAYWENLTAIPCAAMRSFTYTDKEVFPGTISYRVVALRTNGRRVLSEIREVKVDSRK
ncbi:MAG TPA: hypothetical protein VMR70_14130 [Flavisolibacter sp.]|nr:hypothetical protein [Flavisolibacter sp.]